ncbi:MAG: DUF4838 domain-containing protein [Planctomycetota bacterium]|jgi:hypothetical protein
MKNNITKTISIFFLVISFVISVSAAAENILIKDGNINCEIVVPDEAGPMAYFAGEEMQKFLKKSFGPDVNLLTAPSGNKAAIILGRNKLSEKAGIDFTKIKRDGFVVKSSGSNIFIAGNDGMNIDVGKVLRKGPLFHRKAQEERGTLNGVYEFLERYIGARFYFPGKYGTIVPTHQTLTIPAIDLVIAPDHTARSMGFSGELFEGFDEGITGKDVKERAWYYKNLNILRLRLQTRYIPHCHGLREYGYISRFGKSNPEYFALMKSGKFFNDVSYKHAPQLCFSSSIRDEIYKDAEAFLSGKSAESRGVTPRNKGRYYWNPGATQPGYFDIMPQDGYYPCHCKKCQKHLQGKSYSAMNKKTTSEFMWDFFCEIADRLKENHVPGYVCTMAYPPYRDIPEREIPDNVMVALCPSGADAKEHPEIMQHIKDWYKKLGNRKVWLWNNFGKWSSHSMPGVPFIVPKATGAYYKAASPYIYGAYCSLTVPDYYLYKYINAYVAFKVMWDNDTDVDKLLSEHYRVMFGPAALTMEKIYSRFEDNWRNKVRGNTVETALGDTAAPPTEFKLWDQIYSEEEIKYLSSLLDIAETEAVSQQDALERVRFMRKNLFGPLLKEREKYLATLNKIADLDFQAGRISENENIKIDGDVSEEVWQKCKAVTLSPFQAKEEKEKINTVVKAALKGEMLYLAVICDEPKMEETSSEKLPHDSFAIFKESGVEIFLNPSGDRKKYYQIIFTPEGSFTDLAAEKIGSSQKLDKTWDSGAEYAFRKHKSGWTAELSLSLKDLAPYKSDGFPVNFTRGRMIKGQKKLHYSWSPYLKEGFHELENFGTINFKTTENTNLLKNSDFAALTLQGWSIASSRKKDYFGKALCDTEVFKKSGGSLKLSGSGKGVQVRQSLPTLKPATKYRVKFYIKTSSIIPSEKRGACGVRLSIWDKKNNYYPANPYTGTMPWTKQGFEFETSKQVNAEMTSYLELSIFQAAGDAWFDEISVQEIE